MSEQKSGFKWNYIILTIQIIIALSTLVTTIYFHNENLKLLQSGKRADLSLFFEANWSIESEHFNFYVTGEIRNEGTRATDIRRVTVSLVWIRDEGSNYTNSYSVGQATYLGWENMIIEEEETKQLSLQHSINLLRLPSDIESFRKPDDGWIRITHYDGKEEKEQSNLKPNVHINE